MAAFGIAYAGLSDQSSRKLQQTLGPGTAAPQVVEIPRKQPLRVDSLYDDPEVVSDEELAAVLRQIRPRFAAESIKPNFVEHALRTWDIASTFQDPKVMSGVEMRDFLVDHGRYLASWGDDSKPLLMQKDDGVSIRWGSSDVSGSVHHDHWLACLTEAGVNRDQPVFTPARRDMTIDNVIQEALRDFQLDERETEWTAMAFGLWLPPTREWTNARGRRISFDLLARRLMRGHNRYGACSGTHRVYSLALLLRLDGDFQILSPPVRDAVYQHLEKVRDLIEVSQFEEGYWPSNWSAGAKAVEDPIDDPDYRRVIATGHHLEWLAIAPKELHPPREQILKAADWIIANTVEKTHGEILSKYTFYSHVGNALALWRGTRPAEFWEKWQTTHPISGRSRSAL